MKSPTVIGYLLAFINPVILGVLVGYFIYRKRETREHGFRIMILSLTMANVYLAFLLALMFNWMQFWP